MKRILVYVLTLGALASIFPSCHRQSVPKPYGYFRIAIPDTAYNYFDWNISSGDADGTTSAKGVF